ncbi:YciI family protein [Tropicimonas sp. S265A]|uniref:YciI family protein n=1 Tax=Tropicimonas sp. S265A TaxID=3415134 RepID=UPI003C7A41F0
MPAWNDYKSEAKSRGALALELYAVVSTPTGDPALVKENLPDHLAYQAEQESLGTLFLAGPMSDETGAQMQGTGLIIYRTPSLDDARTLADADPMHSSGARSYVLRRWLVNEGSLSLSVGLSTKSVDLG